MLCTQEQKEQAVELINKHQPTAILDSVDNDGDYQYFESTINEEKVVTFNVPWDIACDLYDKYDNGSEIPAFELIEYINDVKDWSE